MGPGRALLALLLLLGAVAAFAGAARELGSHGPVVAGTCDRTDAGP